MKKKVSFVISSLNGGGAEKICVTLANHFNKNGVDVHIVVLNLFGTAYKPLLDKNIPIVNLNTKHARTSLFALRKYLKKYNPQNLLVFNHEIATVFVILRLVFDFKFRLVARNISTLSEKKRIEKSIWHKYFKIAIIKIFYSKVDLIIAQSKTMKNDLVQNFKIDHKIIRIVNNPVSIANDEVIYPEIQSTKEILFIGRLNEVKGLNYLILAFCQVLKMQDNVNLRIVGEGKLKSKLVKMVNKYNITDNVIFTGFDLDIRKYFLSADLTVLTSLYEGFPNVLIESIALGTPIVAFDCKSGPREIIIEGINGFLVRYLDVNHLSSSIIKALDYKWDRKQIINSSKKFKLDIIADKYLKLIFNTTEKNV